MEQLKLKICGMRDPENILRVAALRPDFMGFIFYEKSKRFVGNDFKIPDSFPKTIKRVGVFVNEAPNNIIKLVRTHQLDYVQLHGNETVEVCNELVGKVKIIKAFSVDEMFDFSTVKEFTPFVDYFLFDTKSDNYGGSGKSFDWDIIQKYQGETPFFLSGGLSLENIPQVKSIKTEKLVAVDVNSGIESTPGNKDISKANALVIKLQQL